MFVQWALRLNPSSSSSSPYCASWSICMACTSGAENLKRRRLHLHNPENIAEASFEFFIGPQKHKLRSKYVASGLEHNGYPVFRAEGRPGREAEWIFQAGDGLQRNYGNAFEASMPRFRVPWAPGNHTWEEFTSKTSDSLKLR